ncbi:hypothetical protein SUGI_0502790 [Cryptomeria japonica]|nr:hypothetical protein SUGI_0502790 [Cryptomeria japonica]
MSSLDVKHSSLEEANQKQQGNVKEIVVDPQSICTQRRGAGKLLRGWITIATKNAVAERTVDEGTVDFCQMRRVC